MVKLGYGRRTTVHFWYEQTNELTCHQCRFAGFRSSSAPRNRTIFPAHKRIHCMAPDAYMKRLRISTAVLCCRRTSCRKKFWRHVMIVRCFGCPRLTLPAGRCSTYSSKVRRTSILRWLTFCKKNSMQIENKRITQIREMNTSFARTHDNRSVCLCRLQNWLVGI